MGYKFEQLDVWTRALSYSDQVYGIAEQLPKRERYNLADHTIYAESLCEFWAIVTASKWWLKSRPVSIPM